MFKWNLEFNVFTVKEHAAPFQNRSSHTFVGWHDVFLLLSKKENGSTTNKTVYFGSQYTLQTGEDWAKVAKWNSNILYVTSYNNNTK